MSEQLAPCQTQQDKLESWTRAIQLLVWPSVLRNATESAWFDKGLRPLPALLSQKALNRFCLIQYALLKHAAQDVRYNRELLQHLASDKFSPFRRYSWIVDYLETHPAQGARPEL